MTERALFLDRDGVINEETGYLHRIEDVLWVKGIFSLCRTAQGLGYRLIVVTNQSGLARRYYTIAQFDQLMDWMRAEIRRGGAELDAVYYCPYHPIHGIGEFLREHEDRKPGIGMLRRGEKEFGLDLSQSLMVGDRCTDVLAANSAGLKQAFFIKGTEENVCDGGNYIRVEELAEVEDWIRTNG